ncbi:MAG: hypothetical protein RL710_1305 [Pseudomonadota bacterium]
MKIICVFSLLTLMASACYAVEVRVHNASNVDFKSVVVGGKTYGDIKHGASTSYQTWQCAYNISSVELFANTVQMRFRPRDTNGEGLVAGDEPLCKGRITYLLQIVNGELKIDASIDTK